VTNPEALQNELEHIVAALAPSELLQATQMLEKDPVKNRGPLLQAYESEARAQISVGSNAKAEATVQKALAMHDQQRLPTFNYLLTQAQFGLLEGPGSAGEKGPQYRQLIERLDPIVKADPTGQQYGPLMLELEICSDYLGDRECLLRATGYLEKAKVTELPPGIELDLIEIQVLDKGYGAAVERLDSVLKNKTLEPRLRTVACFYQVWTALAQDNAGRAEHWFRDWQETLNAMRRLGTVGWTFGGASRALESAGSPFSDAGREMLVAMMNAMQDEKAPAVTFRH
jgi:hypothetical protein